MGLDEDKEEDEAVSEAEVVDLVKHPAGTMTGLEVATNNLIVLSNTRHKII